MHVGGFVGERPKTAGCCLVRLTDPAALDALYPPGGPIGFSGSGMDVGMHRGGRDRVDPDATGRHFLSEPDGPRFDTRLGGAAVDILTWITERHAAHRGVADPSSINPRKPVKHSFLCCDIRPTSASLTILPHPHGTHRLKLAEVP